MIQLTSLSSQVRFNNVYETPSINSEWCSQIEVKNDSYVTPLWYSDFMPNTYYGLREIDLNGADLVVAPLESGYSSFSGGFSNNFISTSDGGFAFGGMLDQACIVKVAANFQEEWRTNVGVIGGSMNTINELENGQFFCTWTNLAENSDGIDFYWFNPDGSQQNHIHFAVDGLASYQVVDAKELASGSILCNLTIEQNLYFDNIYLLVNGETGSLIWQKRISVGYFNKQLGWNFSQLEDEMTATIAISTIDSLTDQFNPYGGYFGGMGTMKLNLLTGDSSNVTFLDYSFKGHTLRDFEKTPDGGFIMLVLETNPTYTWKKYLIKLDHNRAEEWRKEYNPLPVDQMEMVLCESFDVDVCQDSGYVVSGWVQDTKSVPTFHNGKQISWVFKTDPCGDVEWNNCGLSNIAQNPTSADSSPQFVMAPNPTNGIITLTSDSVFTNVQIKDVTGKVVASHLEIAPQNRRTIDCSSLSKGVYFVTVQFDSKVVSQRLFIQ